MAQNVTKTIKELDADVNNVVKELNKFRLRWESRLEQLRSQVNAEQRQQVADIMNRIDKALAE